MAPPYDVIPDAAVARYEALSPYNVVRLTRPGREYDRAAQTFDEWLERRILEPDPPSNVRARGSFRWKAAPRPDRGAPAAALRGSGGAAPREDAPGAEGGPAGTPARDNVSLEPLWFIYEGRASGLPQIVDVVSPAPPGVDLHRPRRNRAPALGDLRSGASCRRPRCFRDAPGLDRGTATTAMRQRWRTPRRSGAAPTPRPASPSRC